MPLLRRMSFPALLIIGDLVCILLANLAGFAFHRESSATAAGRFIATYFPFAASWLLASFLVGAYGGDPAQRWDRTARSLGATALAAPLGAVLRGVWLGTPVLPVFVAVMGSVVGGSILVWRLAAEWLLLPRRGE